MTSPFLFREDLSGKRLEFRSNSSWAIQPVFDVGFCVVFNDNTYWFIVNEKWAIPKLEFTPDRFIVTQERLAP